MTFGNFVLSIVTGAGGGLGMYLLYGLPRFKAQAGANRLRSAVMVGAVAAVVSFAIRVTGLI